jgi:hypothetical protein
VSDQGRSVERGHGVSVLRLSCWRRGVQSAHVLVESPTTTPSKYACAWNEAHAAPGTLTARRRAMTATTATVAARARKSPAKVGSERSTTTAEETVIPASISEFREKPRATMSASARKRAVGAIELRPPGRQHAHLRLRRAGATVWAVNESDTITTSQFGLYTTAGMPRQPLIDSIRTVASA